MQILYNISKPAGQVLQQMVYGMIPPTCTIFFTQSRGKLRALRSRKLICSVRRGSRFLALPVPFGQKNLLAKQMELKSNDKGPPAAANADDGEGAQST